MIASNPNIVLRNGEGIHVYEDVEGIVLTSLPEGMLVLPALVWKVNNPSAQPSTSKCEISYRATGFSWKADYTVILN